MSCGDIGAIVCGDRRGSDDSMGSGDTIVGCNDVGGSEQRLRGLPRRHVLQRPHGLPRCCGSSSDCGDRIGLQPRNLMLRVIGFVLSPRVADILACRSARATHSSRQSFLSEGCVTLVRNVSGTQTAQTLQSQAVVFCRKWLSLGRHWPKAWPSSPGMCPNSAEEKG